MKRLMLSSSIVAIIASVGVTSASAATAGEWVNLSDNVAQKVNSDGSVSTRFFGAEAKTAARNLLEKDAANLNAQIGQGTATPDDLAALAWINGELAASPANAARGTGPIGNQNGHQVGTNSVVKSGDTCEVVYSIDHKDGPYSTGGASLRVIASSTAHWDMFGPYKSITNINHYNSGTITPAGPYAGQSPVTASNSADVPAQNNLSASSMTNIYWPTFADQTNFCTASASTIITVTYYDNTTCQITQTTSYPDCTRHP
jgi:hypothetical protein